MLRNWNTVIHLYSGLYNCTLATTHLRLSVSFDALKIQKRYIIEIESRMVLGLQVNTQHNCQRGGNTFIKENSDWVAEHLRAPFRTDDMAHCVHYVIDGVHHVVEMLCLQEPTITEVELIDEYNT